MDNEESEEWLPDLKAMTDNMVKEEAMDPMTALTLIAGMEDMDKMMKEDGLERKQLIELFRRFENLFGMMVDDLRAAREKLEAEEE